jgi:hypothetical protein
MTRRLLLMLAAALRAQAASWRGQWAATAGTRQLGGVWTAQAHEEPDASFGTFELRGRDGATLVAGRWSARKHPDRWEGAWSASTKSGQTLEGSWRARTPLRGALPFSDLLNSALAKPVTGVWTARGRSGNWTLRAVE